MNMGLLWMQCMQRRCLIVIYVFILLSFLTFMIGFPGKYNFAEVIRGTKPEVHNSFKTIPCLPRKNIVFLKTHKCASSSVQNILMRYAHTRNLTIVIPVLPKYNHFFSLVKPFRKEMIAGAPWEILGYNIICHHMVFNKPVIEKIMPKDTLYISIVRDPVSLFESLYEYSELKDFYHMDIEEYARGTKNATIATKLRNRSNGMGRNQMLFDFGVHPSFFDNPRMVQKAVENIEKNFDFVMIAEHFDESIVLLRHILCWELDDVISLTINARMDNYRKNLSEEAAKNILAWNWGDKILYDTFLKKFRETVKEFGEERIKAEVHELRRKRQDWFDYCVQKEVESRNLTSYKIWSNKVTAYVLKPTVHNTTCEDLAKPEKYFTSEIRQYQLIRSLIKGASVKNYGPMSLRHLIDLKVLKGKEEKVARNLLMNQYKSRRKFYHLQHG